MRGLRERLMRDAWKVLVQPESGKKNGRFRGGGLSVKKGDSNPCGGYLTETNTRAEHWQFPIRVGKKEGSEVDVGKDSKTGGA